MVFKLCGEEKKLYLLQTLSKLQVQFNYNNTHIQSHSVCVVLSPPPPPPPTILDIGYIRWLLLSLLLLQHSHSSLSLSFFVSADLQLASIHYYLHYIYISFFSRFPIKLGLTRYLLSFWVSFRRKVSEWVSQSDTYIFYNKCNISTCIPETEEKLFYITLDIIPTHIITQVEIGAKLHTQIYMIRI